MEEAKHGKQCGGYGVFSPSSTVSNSAPLGRSKPPGATPMERETEEMAAVVYRMVTCTLLSMMPALIA